MAKTSDYMDYLDREVGIAPANSQEEFQAAETIVEIMKDHGLEPTIQEFDAHPVGKMLPDILAVTLFLGVLLSGLGSTALRLIGVLFAIVSAALLVMRHFGHDVISNVGPAARSQNVIAVHKATGDKVTKGNRPIVVVAHYDAPRESPLFERFAPYQARLARATVPCTFAAALLALMQLFGFLPGGLRAVLWIVGLLAMVPSLVLAVCAFVEKASPCTLGANDNKSSVAALLALLDRVRPQGDRVSATSGNDYEDGADEADQAGDARGAGSSEAQGVRHGKDVLESLGILPETCEIVYEAPTTTQGSDATAPAVSDEEYAEVYDDEAGVDEAFSDDVAATEAGGEYADAGADEYDSYGVEEEAETSEVADEEQGGGTEEPNEVQADEGQTDTDAYADSAEGDPYEEPPADEHDSWEDEEWDDDADQQAQAETKPGGSFGARVKGLFASLKERVSHGSKDADVSIPRGTAADGVDYSEFEETDWGEDDWGDDAYQPQEELKSINRDELVARRAAAQGPDSQEGSEDGEAPTDSSEPAEAEAAVDEIPEQVPEDAGAYYNEYDETSVQDESSDAEPGEDEVMPDAPEEDDAPIEARTSHDISHENGPDWSIVEDDEQVVSSEQPAAVDPAIYQQNEDVADADAGLGSPDLLDVEEELEEDQVASAPIRPRAATPTVPTARAEEPEGEEPTADGNDQAPAPAVDAEPELSWDDNSDQDASDGDDVLPKDSRGLDTMSDDYDAYDEASGDDELEEPDPIDDPTWGTTSYVPPKPKSNVALRATLYDVPSPSDDTIDPLADESDDIDADAADGTSRQQDNDGQSSDANRARNWKGGAAVRSDLRGDEEPADGEPYAEDADVAYEEPEQPADEEDYGTQDVGEPAPETLDDDDDAQAGIEPDEMQDAILQMGDDLLVSHDIWFVAVGASSVDHAGIKAFLSDFRKDIRGAFLINLDSIGAGEPTILTSEGLHEGRRADRRLVRLMSGVAEDLHLPLAKRPYDWNDTDATDAMRSRVRSVTIMGMDQNGLPALSHTQDDVPENVDPKQVTSIVRLIAEAIRRS